MTAKLYLFLLLKAFILIALILFGSIHLAPDEAQYWTWSQDLDWGYYSKPPAIAWQIFLTTYIFGQSELGVRFGAIILGFLLPLAVYYLARKEGVRVAFWAAIVMAFCPLGFYLSFVATTDAGMILCLVLALCAAPNYLLAGFWILLGSLYKWTAFLFWPFALIFMIFFPPFRKWSFLGGLLISLLAFLPSLYWNDTHEWATFRHVGKTIAGASASGNFFDFLGAQIGLISPIFFGLLLMSFFFLHRASSLLWRCAAFPGALIIFFAASLFKKMQPNWGAFLYPPGMVLISWIGLKWNKGWLYAGTLLSIFLVALGFSIPYIQEHGHFGIPYRINPFRQSLGWNRLPKILEEAGYDSKEDFLFGDKYQTASLLSFYSQDKKRAYFFNISDTRKNQFSYWPQMQDKEVGKRGFFVVIENRDPKAIGWYEGHYLERLSPYFEQVRYLGAYPLFEANGAPVKFAMLFEADGYLGNSPEAKVEY